MDEQQSKARLLLLLVGMPGSGKSVVADEARNMGLPVFNMGDVVREEALRRYGAITHELMMKVAIELRREFGDDYVAKRTLEKAEGSYKAVIDGVRSLAEVEAFRAAGRVVIVAVHASPLTRFCRLLKRGRPGDPKTWGEFVARDMTELGLGIGNVIALADYVIVNEGSLEELRAQARSVLGVALKNGARPSDCRG